MKEIIIGFIVLGLFIFILTGLGILTVAVFGISEGQTSRVKPESPETKDFITNVLPNLLTIPPEKLGTIIAAIPTKPQVTEYIGIGEQIIGLNDTNLMLSKISLITIWIIIIIGVLFGSYKILFKF
jgi:hypothetical protein